ncbi:hypothetical protein FRC12_012621 [Ceratobasidium sp. 428]|nr:hypothetical protein FRC12_012621 [Ceratobasidium sp. 428]
MSSIHQRPRFLGPDPPNLGYWASNYGARQTFQYDWTYRLVPIGLCSGSSSFTDAIGAPSKYLCLASTADHALDIDVFRAPHRRILAALSLIVPMALALVLDGKIAGPEDTNTSLGRVSLQLEM